MTEQVFSHTVGITTMETKRVLIVLLQECLMDTVANPTQEGPETAIAPTLRGMKVHSNMPVWQLASMERVI